MPNFKKETSAFEKLILAQNNGKKITDFIEFKIVTQTQMGGNTVDDTGSINNIEFQVGDQTISILHMYGKTSNEYTISNNKEWKVSFDGTIKIKCIEDSSWEQGTKKLF